MIQIRPAWETSVNGNSEGRAGAEKLFELEQRARVSCSIFFKLAEIFIDEDISNLESLRASSVTDLVAGCELIRGGYIKQAYSLWRSWFEQSMFMLYFLEAELHKLSWKVSVDVDLNDSPKHRLMLHQLLVSSGDKHPFVLVYEERYKILNEQFGISLPKGLGEKNPIKTAERILTTLSQGVHGTFQPKGPQNVDEGDILIEKKHNKILEVAVDTIDMFWILLIVQYVSLPKELLTSMRNRTFTREEMQNTGLEYVDELCTLYSSFAKVFGV